MPVRRLNHAVLYVRDIDRAVDFYTDVLGFRVKVQVPGRTAFLGARDSLNDHDLGLFALGPDALGPGVGRVGLYHLAWEVGTLGELLEAARSLRSREALVGSSDHVVSKSLYAKDPDGNEFEVMWRVPRADWPTGHTLAAPLPLDLEEAVNRWGADLETGSAAGSAT